MTNTDVLNQIIKDKGIKYTRIAAALGISNASLSVKLARQSDFTGGQMMILKDLLGLTMKQCQDIFLP